MKLSKLFIQTLKEAGGQLFYQIQKHALSQDSYLGVGAPGLYWPYSIRGEVRVWELAVFILVVLLLLFELGRWLADKNGYLQ